jgi:hypothetical protein
MKRTTDLQAALRFVSDRIEEEARLSGDPLSHEQRVLLSYPISPTPRVWASRSGPPPLVPRDVNYERLSALAKAVYQDDLQASPESLDWEFAFAVFRLNRHPMWGLLQQAGVKYHKPWWDDILLLGSSLLIVAVPTALLLLLGKQPWTMFQWAAFGAVYTSVLVCIYFAARRTEEGQVHKEIERCRSQSRFVNAAAG